MKNRINSRFQRLLLGVTYSVILLVGFSSMLQAQNLESSPPKIVSFRISPTTVKTGEWVKFYWEVKDAERVRLYANGREIKGRHQLPNGEFGWPLSMSGGFKSKKNKTTTYELVAENREGKTTRRTFTVRVAAFKPPSGSPPPKIVSFKISPTTVKAGEFVKFYWNVKDAESVKLFDNFGEIQSNIQLQNGEFGWPLIMSGTYSTTQNKTETYKLVAENREGKTTKTFTVRVQASQLQGTYTIQQKSNRRYLDAHEGSNDNSVVTRNRQNNTTQAWILTPLGKNTYTIQQKSNRRYMDAHEGSNDNSVVTRNRQNNNTQRWIIKPL